MRARGLQQTARLQQQSAHQAAGRIGREQHPICEVRPPVAQVARKFGHLRLIRVADKERGRPEQQGHGQQNSTARHHLHGRPNIGETADGRMRRPPAWDGESIRRTDQPHEQRRVDQRIDENPISRSQTKQQCPTERGTDHESEVSTGRIETHRTRQLLHGDHLVNQHLRGGEPDHTRETVNDEQQHRHRERQRIGPEHDAPTDRHAHEQQHADLNEAADVETIGQRTGESGE